MLTRFSGVALEAVSCALPEEVLPTAELERRLAPLYGRLGLSEGRLELMTGIRERRLWPAGFLPSQAGVLAGRAALAQAGADPGGVGCLVHAAVSRDRIEPATACAVHRGLGLPPECLVFDLSNACLGVLDAMVLVAGLIETGRIQRGLVVAGEDGRPLLERTVRALLAPGMTRASIKPHFASLTVGSAAAAVLLARADLTPTGRRLVAGAALAATEHADLCQGGSLEDGGLAMHTDSEELLRAGVELAGRTWPRFLEVTGWEPGSLARTVCHQVGAAHRRAIHGRLGLDPARDRSSFEVLGNTGAAALPATLALAAARGDLPAGGRVGLLGIGSGLNCLMLGVEW